ncbi:MAG: Histidinol-phosphate aminotransferase [Candidatus Gottesmanbacteria bacterium GW2011_GWB1_43_11]|uniref:Aminotransferase n=1 Tax=Candidatus Gottesmanbacteria bacterium GW2011_GWB1_43_11 TaxID=1618446 RepID=A0A0G1ESX3_9BACT|nr:MAG: Histidinol-phosphate aminotransferase [Candidatus Gottesmanbacteria bacterium GW2011_GWA2_42_16]KKS53634.1 MAG: Histidinol-phosphate aminotransferase [Candidatus Gottesmanbacteria bacterium GW2011_GWA1_42_26]KKS81082.1 MAG: Histidinol-phosphate aminotransferase [Candidatus Gottesmanbacteria bacterium GW2011_GWC1_43_10]KKS86181.1 MAG: Histidinol-phosphate aminotransferase [Candidatus Gottesmanbacteria bacterium GW2011_GWB1_43_11]
MDTNDNFKFWQQHKTSSYVHFARKTKLHHFNMGEFLLAKHAIAYPDPTQHALKTEFSRLWKVNPDWLSLGCGSDEIIETIPRIFLNSGDTALVVTPTFFRFLDATRKIGASVIEIATEKEKGFNVTEMTISDIIRVTHEKNVKLIWLCNPNNPTGNIIQESLIAKLVNSIKTLVVIDEAFFGLSPISNMMRLLVSTRNNIILLRSMSKIDGLAGLRIGIAISNSEIIKVFEEWRLPFNIPKLSLDFAVNHLKNIRKLKPNTKFINHERTRILESIRLSKHLKLGGQSQTSIFLLRHKKQNLFDLLLKQGILGADMSNTPGLERLGFVRLTIKSKRENDFLLMTLRKIDACVI